MMKSTVSYSLNAIWHAMTVIVLMIVLVPATGHTQLAKGEDKFLGNVYSRAQIQDFEKYWNFVVPENAGKWGSVERARDEMNWAELDAAYKLAKDNGYQYRHHVLIWGNQQPAWIETLPPDEQLEEITEWFTAVAERYPDIDYIEVVNEPTNDPPNKPGQGGGNYIEALGGDGETGWDWILTAFRLARELFPNTKLVLNDYNIVSNDENLAKYLEIIDLLKAENLIDVAAVQAHAFSLTGPEDGIRDHLDQIAAKGLPIMVTELDIDGPTDEQQLADFKRIIPVFWEHPALIGMTFWGWRPGQWRTQQGANLVQRDGEEKPSMVWLREYIAGTN